MARGAGIQENFSLHTHLPFEFLYPVRLLPSQTNTFSASSFTDTVHPNLSCKCSGRTAGENFQKKEVHPISVL